MTDFIRIPPDSTGKRIRQFSRVEIVVNNVLINLSTINKGDTILGNTSGKTATYLDYSSEYGVTSIFVTDQTGTFTVGETLSVSGTDISDVVSSLEVFTPTSIQVDSDNPSNRQKIDSAGSSYVRYSEGDLPFDVFGHAQFTQNSTIDTHVFTYGSEGFNRYYDATTSGGSISVDVPSSTLLLSTNTTSGSAVTRTTHQYYPYTPGVGTEIQMSILSGDNGKAGVVRKWGMFDDENGVFFKVSGSVFQVGLRNNSTGTIIDEIVSQIDFNGDKLNDIGSDEYLLDLSKFNLYWIDFAWLGVGRVRMGTFSPKGKRVTLHTFQNPNSKTVPYMNLGTLPFRIEQYNETATASTSELRATCVSIQKQTIQEGYNGKHFTATSKYVTVSGSSGTPLLSIIPVATFNSKINRTTAFAVDYEYIVDGSSVILDTVVNANLTGSTWSEPTGSFSSTLIDIDATSYTGGLVKGTIVLPSGAGRRIIRENLDNTLSILANGTPLPATLVAKTADPSGSANVLVIARWKEVR